MKRLESLTSASTINKSPTKWLPPPPGYLRLDVDASYNRNINAYAIGGAVRDHQGRLICAFGQKIIQPLLVTHGELIAIHERLKLLRYKNYQGIHVTSNSLLTVQAVTKPQEDLGYMGNIAAEIGELMKDLMFLDLFGDAQSIKKADDRHAKLFLPHKSVAESKKRYAEDYLFSDKSKLAKSLVSPSAPSAVDAYTGTPNQWAAGYGLQPQAWPQASQAQAQQWTPGYSQQGAYGAYGTGYTHPQIPTSQSVVYGTYPPTYPTQAYAQPATNATLPAAQQPAATPSTYYGTYY